MNRPHTPQASAYALSLFILLLLFIHMSGPACGERVVVVFDRPEFKADMTLERGENISLHLHANVTVEVEYATTIYFTVSGVPWASTVSPQSKAVLPGTTVVNVDALVIVPWNATDGVYPVGLNAVWDTPQGTPVRTGNTTLVEVVQNRIGLEGLPDSVAYSGNGTVGVAFVVRNRASVEDTFSVNATLMNGTGAEERASVSISPSRFSLLPGETQAVQISIDMGERGANGTSNTLLALTVVSDNDTASVVERNVSIHAHVPYGAGGSGLGRLILILGVVSVVGVVVFFGGVEWALLSLLGLLSPLFVRLEREKVLDNFIRGEIYGYVLGNPGCSFSDITSSLDLSNGVASYHLSVLVREGFLRTLKDGIRRRYYPMNTLVKKGRYIPSRLQKDIIRYLREHPGAGQSEVARALGESKQVIHYHMGVLRERGLVRVEREGRRTLCFLTDLADRPEVIVVKRGEVPGAT
ncbi:MAG: helix-turn-helix domain-containing protein [Thermoplasmata archaeon]|nr:helix-turn-helix domain-containing protein [Thermoplasmata archaeon]